MIYIAGAKDEVLYVATIAYDRISPEDENALKALMEAAGIKDLKILDTDPRIDQYQTKELFPHCATMFMLPKEPPLVSKCRCGKIGTREQRLCLCGDKMTNDVTLIGLPWEH